MTMNDGVVIWLRGAAPDAVAALAHGLSGAICWPAGADMVCMVAPQAGEHLSVCVARVAAIVGRQGVALGLAVGPLPPAGQVNPTAERAQRAAALAAAGDVILAWGSQAYLAGEFESVAAGFVKLIELP